MNKAKSKRWPFIWDTLIQVNVTEKRKELPFVAFFVSCNIQTTHARYIVFGSSFCFPWSNNATVDRYQPSCCSHILHTPLWVLWVQLFHIHKIFEKVCKYVCLWMCVSESASFRDCDRQLKPFTQQYPISSGLYSLVSGCPSLLGLTGASDVTIQWDTTRRWVGGRVPPRLLRQTYVLSINGSMKSSSAQWHTITVWTVTPVQLCSFLPNRSHSLCSSWLNLITAVLSLYNVSSCWGGGACLCFTQAVNEASLFKIQLKHFFKRKWRSELFVA